jgi:hypothetical protein
MNEKKCKECNKRFKVPETHPYKIFCSDKCRWKNKNRRYWKECPDCGKIIKRWNAKFCKSCSHKMEKSYLWKGGKIKKLGYVWVYQPEHPFARDKYVMEHRLIMEKKLGRYLTEDEIVHHKNKIKDDNREENLRLFKNNGEHIKFHNIIKAEVEG